MGPSSLYLYKPYHYHYDYDFVFTGAGASGLSLLMRMLRSGEFSDKSFLLVDRDRKDRNDRTWCFWEKENGFFEDIVQHRWNKTWFHADGFSRCFDLHPYQYKMIRGLDFYHYCFDYIKRFDNVRILHEPVVCIDNENNRARLTLENGMSYYAGLCLFNSILFTDFRTDNRFLWQHFKGWLVETEEPTFDSDTNTLMDFRTGQQEGTTFVYTMPLDSKKALVEYTLFSAKELKQELYDQGLEQYMREVIGQTKYSVTAIETGRVPMTDYVFPKGEGRIIQIGTAGGLTKGSSGYTFQFIQKHSENILKAMMRNKHPLSVKTTPDRFRFYDKVLLEVLIQGTPSGKTIFSRLFKTNPVRRILSFLDNESNLLQDLQLISSLPTLPFLKAALKTR